MAKISRNDPCPCGSGKKYKHCCIRKGFEWNDQRAETCEKIKLLTIEGIQPSPEEKCVCASGKAFRECCSLRLASGAPWLEGELYDQGRFDEALRECRAHFTWYILCHRAHTVPLLEFDKASGEEILFIDIEALDYFVGTLWSCYRATGISGKFLNTLDALQDTVRDDRWLDKIAFRKALWWSVEKANDSQAASCMGQIDIDKCIDPDIITGYLDFFFNTLSFEKRNDLCDKVCRLTDDESMRLQYRFLKGISYMLICETNKAIKLMNNAVDDYVSATKDKNSFDGDRLYAQSLVFLGQLTGRDDMISKAESIYQDFIDNPEHKFTNFGISQYHLALGQCNELLEDHNNAAGCFERSLSICPNALASVHLAKSHIAQGDIESGRKILDGIDTKSLTPANFDDYARARTILAVASRNPNDIETAKAELKRVTANAPLFAQQRDQQLIKLLETVPHSDASWVKKTIRFINRYVSLNPNLFGIGLNFNSFLENYDPSSKRSPPS